MFPEFNPQRHYRYAERRAEIIAQACGVKDLSEMTAYFLDRPRHHLPMDQLNSMGVATPYDKDGDLFPAVVMGLDGLRCPDGRGFHSMIGEIGGERRVDGWCPASGLAWWAEPGYAYQPEFTNQKGPLPRGTLERTLPLH